MRYSQIERRQELMRQKKKYVNLISVGDATLTNGSIEKLIDEIVRMGIEIERIGKLPTNEAVKPINGSMQFKSKINNLTYKKHLNGNRS